MFADAATLVRTNRNHTISFRFKFLIVLVVAIQATFCWMARQRSLSGDVDLRAFYAAGVAVRHGAAADLYDVSKTTQTQQHLFGHGGRTLPFLYPAFAALPFVTVSSFRYPAVFVLVLIANLSMLFLVIWLLNHFLLNTRFATGWLFGLSLCFFPTSIALMQGQISFALLLVFTLSYILAGRGRPILAGLCLSLALAKFQFVLPVVLLLLLGRRWRVVTGFALGSMGVIAVSLRMTGVQGAQSYIACIKGLSTAMLRDPALARTHFGMQTATEPNLHGLVMALAGVGTSTTLLLAGASLLVMAWAARRPNTVATALPAAMLISYHMQPYDLTLLLLPIFVLLREAADSEQKTSAIVKILAGAGLLLLTMPVAAYLLAHSQTVWFVLAVGCLMFSVHAGPERPDVGMRVRAPSIPALA